MKIFLKYNLPWLVWGIAILVVSILPGNYFPKVTSFWEMFSPDKLIHLVLFAVLVILLIIGFSKQYAYKKPRSNYVFYALLIGIIYGGITELLQMLINNGRHASISDFFADSLGCLFGLLICRKFLRKKQKI